MSDASRRKLLKSIASGGGAIVAGKSLPESWTRPVVDSVLLPVHAQTSGGTGFTALSLGKAKEQNEILNVLVPSANAANIATPDPSVDVCINVINGVAFIQVTVEDDPQLYTGEYELSFSEGKPLSPASGNVYISCEYLEGGNPNSTSDDQVTGVVNANGPGIKYIAYPSSAVCQLSASAPPPVVPSDRSIKDNFSPVDEQEILRKVASLPIEMWNYTDREQGVRHIGPMAQDFMESFNVGDSDRHIHMVDANGVNLAAIKALNSKLEEKDSQIRDLQQQLAGIMSRLEKLA